MHGKAMAFKLMETVQKKWQRLKYHQNSANVITGVKRGQQNKLAIIYSTLLETHTPDLTGALPNPAITISIRYVKILCYYKPHCQLTKSLFI